MRVNRWQFVMVMVGALVAGSASGWAAYEADNAADMRVESESADSIFNKIGDWFATVGKSEPEKSRIKAERRMARAADRAEETLERRADDVADNVGDAVDWAGDELEQAGDKVENEIQDARSTP